MFVRTNGTSHQTTTESLIFVGDVATPFPVPNSVAADFPRRAGVVANLEGPISANVKEHLERRVLFSHPSVIEYFERAGIRAAVLANNHITDIPDALSPTLESLQEAGIACAGAGMSPSAAAKPAEIRTGAGRVLLFAFGWPAIECQPVRASRPGVTPMSVDLSLALVGAARATSPLSPIVAYMHWGYELARYPLPAHRMLAHALIDAGADLVVGCHAHRVQGAETYQDRPIVYGLGNWYVPREHYFAKRLTFPPYCDRELAFEWRLDGTDHICHWYRWISEKELVHERSEPLRESPIIDSLSPFAGLSHKHYAEWYRKYGKHRRTLPRYDCLESIDSAPLKDAMVRTRTRLARLTKPVRAAAIRLIPTMRDSSR